MIGNHEEVCFGEMIHTVDADEKRGVGLSDSCSSSCCSASSVSMVKELAEEV